MSTQLSTYEQSAINFLKTTGTEFKARFSDHKKHFAEDKERRDVFRCTLKNSRHTYRFNFGQSTNESTSDGGNPPTAYDVLACLTKYDPGTFENFCGDFGYDIDSRKAYKTYKAVIKEWKNVELLFTAEELEQLQEIN